LLKVYWDNIPENLDILITHGPPFGIFDRTAKKVNAGCKYLLAKIQKVKPKIHIFGHIHEGRAKFG
jgi:Icc-related predicted phosphoesterase